MVAFDGRGSVSENRKEAVFIKAGVPNVEIGLHWRPVGQWLVVVGFVFVAGCRLVSSSGRVIGEFPGET